MGTFLEAIIDIHKVLPLSFVEIFQTSSLGQSEDEHFWFFEAPGNFCKQLRERKEREKNHIFFNGLTIIPGSFSVTCQTEDDQCASTVRNINL